MYTGESMWEITAADSPDMLWRHLRGRVPLETYRRRLELERAGPEPLFDRHQFSLHPENWRGFPATLRMLLRTAGLYRRGRRNALNVRLREHTLHVKGLPPAFHGYRLLQISDPHLDMNPDVPAVLADVARSVRADACVFTGDFRFATDGDCGDALGGLAKLMGAVTAPAYAVLGNHDCLAMIPPMEALGIRVLFNEGVPLRRGDAALWLAGVDDPHYFQLHDLDAALVGRPPTAPALLLAHSPEIHAGAAAIGFKAMLCGHTHGGQICLPGGIPLLTNARCARRYSRGSWQCGGLSGYTSLGAGASVLDVRFNSPAEIVLHELRKH